MISVFLHAKYIYIYTPKISKLHYFERTSCGSISPNIFGILLKCKIFSINLITPPPPPPTYTHTWHFIDHY